MSITFSVLGAKTGTKDVPCSDCDGTGVNPNDRYGEPPCQFCTDGVVSEYESDCEELNVTGMNCDAILALVDPTKTCYDSWSPGEVPQIIVKVMRILNSDDKRKLESDTETFAEPGKCIVIVGGRDAAYVQDRLTKLLKVLRDAQGRNTSVIWG